jgi:hypothetical protein
VNRRMMVSALSGWTESNDNAQAAAHRTQV